MSFKEHNASTPETTTAVVKKWPVANDGLARQLSEFADETTLPHGDDARAASGKPTSMWTRLTQQVTRSRVVAVAMVLVAAIAIAEGVYIFRLSRVQQSATAVQQPAAATIAPTVTAPPVPEATAPPPAPRSDIGRLVVRSEPSGAEVILDDQRLGVTPLTLDDVAVGTRQLRVRRAGAEVRQTVHIEPGQTLSVLAPLALQPTTAPSGYLSISAPIALDIIEDGALLGTSRSQRIMLQAGIHRLLLVNESLGYRGSQEVRVDAGKTSTIQIQVPSSTIHINARPWAEVLIDGRSVGETPIGNHPIAVGTHEIVFRHPQLGERKVTTTVKIGTPTRLAVDFSQTPRN